MIETHQFEVGMKLEAVDTKNNNTICPATVESVVNSRYFIISIDTMSKQDSFITRYCCHHKFPMIFPVNWASTHGIKVSCPKGLFIATIEIF